MTWGSEIWAVFLRAFLTPRVALVGSRGGVQQAAGLGRAEGDVPTQKDKFKAILFARGLIIQVPAGTEWQGEARSSSQGETPVQCHVQCHLQQATLPPQLRRSLG